MYRRFVAQISYMIIRFIYGFSYNVATNMHTVPVYPKKQFDSVAWNCLYIAKQPSSKSEAYKAANILPHLDIINL